MPKLKFKEKFNTHDLFNRDREILCGWGSISVTPYKSNTYIITKTLLDILKTNRNSIYLDTQTSEFIHTDTRGNNKNLYPVKMSFFDILPNYEFKF